MAQNFLYNFVKKNNITKPLFISYFIAIFVIFYFGFFIIFGSKGLVEYFNLRAQIQNKEAAKQEIFAKMQAKKNMVDGMNLNSLDLDLLDEQARKVLGYSGKNEVVIYQEKDSSTKNQN